MTKDFLHQYAYNFVYIYKNIFLLIDNQQEQALAQMNQYYAKLSEVNKNKVNLINSYIEGLDNIKVDLYELLTKVTLIDRKEEATANFAYINILCELAQLRSDLNSDKLDVYFDESFLPDEIPSDSLKSKGKN